MDPQTQVQPQSADSTTGSLDPQAVAMAQAIRQVESGGDFSAQGKSGEQGAYQWLPETWNAMSKEAGVNVPLAQATPEQQNEVAYKQIKQWKDQGYNVGQVASMWNSGNPDAYLNQNYQGTNASGAQYNTPQYAKDVATYYQSFKGGQSPQGAGGTNLAPGVPALKINSPNTPSASTGQINGGYQNIPLNPVQKAAQSVVNFAFPIIGDAINDIQGKDNKTALQQLGDLGLSALWFIPGLGEVGEGIKGAALAVGKGAALGYGAGVLANLSQGKSVGQSATPNVQNLAGAAFGGVAPLAIKALGGAIKGIVGISPQIENALKDGSIPVEQFNQYMTAAKNRATDVRAPSALGLAADSLDQAASKVDESVAKAGSIVGAAKKGLSDLPVPDINNVVKDFETRASEDFGAFSGPSRMTSLSTADQGRLQEIYNGLKQIGGNETTARTVSDLMNKIDNQINYGKASYAGGLDPLSGFLLKTRGALNDVLRQSSPDFAKANDTFSVLKSVQNEINSMAGTQNQRGELLMKRVFSGDKSGQVQDLFNKIKQITGTDLVNDAVLAKYAVDTVGDASQKSLLQQTIEGVVAGHAQGILPTILNMARSAAVRTFANPEAVGRKLVTGATGAVPGLITKLAARGGAGLIPVRK